jgi:hypothetical protein
MGGLLKVCGVRVTELKSDRGGVRFPVTGVF